MGVEEYVKLAIRATDNYLNAPDDDGLTSNVTDASAGLTISAQRRP
jgi:hypothetical protein